VLEKKKKKISEDRLERSKEENFISRFTLTRGLKRERRSAIL
jgi:hypothetical protein